MTCPADHAGPGAIDDLHRDLHAHPGRRRRRHGRQHRDRDRHPADRRRRHVGSPTTTPTHDLDPRAAIDLDKRPARPIDVDGNGRADAGDTIAYTFVVTNTGNVTLTAVTVTDPKVGAGHLPGRRRSRRARSTTCTATYTLTQADVDAGAVDNTATARAHRRPGPPVTAAGHRRPPTIPARPVDRARQVGGARSSTSTATARDAGDTIAYTFMVTNTGNVTLDPVTVDRPEGRAR